MISMTARVRSMGAHCFESHTPRLLIERTHAHFFARRTNSAFKDGEIMAAMITEEGLMYQTHGMLKKSGTFNTGWEGINGEPIKIFKDEYLRPGVEPSVLAAKVALGGMRDDWNTAKYKETLMSHLQQNPRFPPSALSDFKTFIDER